MQNITMDEPNVTQQPINPETLTNIGLIKYIMRNEVKNTITTGNNTLRR